MPSPAQQYLSLATGIARSDTQTGVSEQTGAEGFMGKATTAGALGANALYPVVKNNMSYASNYMGLAKGVQDVGKATGIYSGYKTALGMTAGPEQFSQTVSPGNIVKSGVEMASYMNPFTAIASGVNYMTADEENPHGTIPGVSHLKEKVSEVADKVNQSEFGQTVKQGATSLYNNTIGPVLDTKVGQLGVSALGMPLGMVESGYNTLKEGYELLDRGIFKGLLPGGADLGDKDRTGDTWRTDDPLVPMKNAYHGLARSAMALGEKDTEPMVVDGGVEDMPNYEAILGNPDKGEVDYMGNKFGSTGGEKVGDDYNKLEQARNVHDADKGDPESLNSLLDDLLTIGESKGMADSTRTPEYEEGSWGEFSKPHELNTNLEFKTVNGFSTYYKEGTDIPYEYTLEFGKMYGQMDNEQVMEFWNDMSGAPKGDYSEGTRWMRANPNYSAQYHEYPFKMRDVYRNASAGAKTDKEFLNNLKPGWGEDGGLNAELAKLANQKSQATGKYGNLYRGGGLLTNTMAEGLAESGLMGVTYTSDGPQNRPTPGQNNIDMSLYDGTNEFGFSREIGRQGMSLGGGTGFTDKQTGFQDKGFGDYRIFI